MSPDRLGEVLALLRWSRRGLSDALGCDDRLVRRWASGDAAVPRDVAVWLCGWKLWLPRMNGFLPLAAGGSK